LRKGWGAIAGLEGPCFLHAEKSDSRMALLWSVRVSIFGGKEIAIISGLFLLVPGSIGGGEKEKANR